MKHFSLLSRHYLYTVFLLAVIVLAVDLVVAYHPASVELMMTKSLELTPTSRMIVAARLLSNSIFVLGGLTVSAWMYFCWSRNWRDAVFLGMTLVSLISIAPLKALFHRDRPEAFLLAHPQTVDYGFPSGHSLAVSVLTAALLYLYIRHRPSASRWRWIIYAAAVLYILLVGWSRVALGFHFPTDVLGGYLFGLGYFLVFSAIRDAWHRPS